MPWHRHYLGSTSFEYLIHVLYEHFKSERMYWTTQCGIQFSHRENRVRRYQPLVTSARPTCVPCIVQELRVGSRW